MQGKDAVVFRGDRGGVSVLLNPDVPFGIVVEELRRKLSASRDFFSGASIRLDAGDRPLDAVEMRVLNELIRAHGLTLVDAEEQQAPPASATPVAPRREAHSVRRSRGANGAVEESVRTGVGEMEDEPCLFVQRTLRSGQRLEFDGSVVILGDVNPGAVVVATGHVIVMGALRGVVHAGARGDVSARVIALRLQPTQLRIAQYISRPPDGHEPHPTGPEMALVVDDRIQIEQFAP